MTDPHATGSRAANRHGHAITLYVADHATKEQVEHIQQTLQIAIDKLPDRAFIIVDVPKHIPSWRVIEMKHEIQRMIADSENDGNMLEGGV